VVSVDLHEKRKGFASRVGFQKVVLWLLNTRIIHSPKNYQAKQKLDFLLSSKIWKGVRYCYIRVTLCIVSMVFLWIIMSFSFPFSFLRSVIKVFRDHVKIIALFWRDTTTTTTITFLLFPPSTTSTVIAFLSLRQRLQRRECIPPHSDEILPQKRRWLVHPRAYCGSWCTLYYFPRIPLKLRPWRFFTSTSKRL